MDHTTVLARVHCDNTGVVMELPVILTDADPLRSLLDYLLDMHGVRSYSWMQKIVQAVRLLLDYMAANHHCFDDPNDMFKSFVRKLYSGTIG